MQNNRNNGTGTVAPHRLDSIRDKTTYANYEIIIVDNNSEED